MLVSAVLCWGLLAPGRLVWNLFLFLFPFLFLYYIPGRTLFLSETGFVSITIKSVSESQHEISMAVVFPPRPMPLFNAINSPGMLLSQ